MHTDFCPSWLRVLHFVELQLTECQPLSLLLKASPYLDELALYDVVNTPGVATDLSHISSPAVCLYFSNMSRAYTE
jgi:hypothetical protein